MAASGAGVRRYSRTRLFPHGWRLACAGRPGQDRASSERPLFAALRPRADSPKRFSRLAPVAAPWLWPLESGGLAAGGERRGESRRFTERASGLSRARDGSTGGEPRPRAAGYNGPRTRTALRPPITRRKLAGMRVESF